MEEESVAKQLFVSAAENLKWIYELTNENRPVSPHQVHSLISLMVRYFLNFTIRYNCCLMIRYLAIFFEAKIITPFK